ncbi:hypothetical protein F0Z19_3845 [Vibrio cyclitrophicus]|nr:hypothetical protein F0Z19_3845 [Vibrio cyclitrophicus]
MSKKNPFDHSNWSSISVHNALVEELVGEPSTKYWLDSIVLQSDQYGPMLGCFMAGEHPVMNVPESQFEHYTISFHRDFVSKVYLKKEDRGRYYLYASEGRRAVWLLNEAGTSVMRYFFYYKGCLLEIDLVDDWISVVWLDEGEILEAGFNFKKLDLPYLKPKEYVCWGFSALMINKIIDIYAEFIAMLPTKAAGYFLTKNELIYLCRFCYAKHFADSFREEELHGKEVELSELGAKAFRVEEGTYIVEKGASYSIYQTKSKFLFGEKRINETDIGTNMDMYKWCTLGYLSTPVSHLKTFSKIRR